MFAVSLTLLALLPVIFSIGLPTALNYFGARKVISAREYRRLFLGICGLGVLASAATLYISTLLEVEYRNQLFIISISLLIMIPISCMRSLVIVSGGFGVSSWESWTTNVVRLIILIILFATGTLTVMTATITVTAVSVVASAVWWSRIRAVFRNVSAPIGSPPVPVRRILHYSSASWLGQLASISNGRLDQLLLAFFTTTSEIGIYAVAVTWAQMPLLFVSAAQIVTNVRAVAIQSEAESARITRLSASAGVVGSIAFAILAPFVITFVFGPQFHEAVELSWILAPGLWFAFHGYMYSALLAARGRPGLQSAGEFAGLIITVVGLAILVPIMGVIGAAITSSICYAVTTVVARMMLTKTGFTHKTVGIQRGDISWAVAAIRKATQRS